MENEMNNEVNQNHPAVTNRWLYILLVVLALGIIGLSVWLISLKGEMNDLLVEKNVQKYTLEQELEQLMADHVLLKESYGEVSDSLATLDSLIQANAAEIKELLNYKWEFFTVKKKLDKLQKVAQGYVRQMDSIVTVNQELTQENFQIKEEIKQQKREYKNLEKVRDDLNTKVDEASILSVYNLQGTPVYMKGGGKEVETDKIRRVNRIRVCFTVGANTIVEPGSKTLYVRIAQPDKEILVPGRGKEYSFISNGETLQYSIKKDFNYQNEAFQVCVNWDKRDTQEMFAGTYHVDIFDGDNNIGHTTFTLK
ncbi:MAG TPA: hypothetical protein VIN10_02140 [Bacteroidales bacterium]